MSRRKAKRNAGAPERPAGQASSAAPVDSAVPVGSAAGAGSALGCEPNRSTRGAIDAAAQGRRRWLLTAALVVEAGWIAALVALALTTPK